MRYLITRPAGPGPHPLLCFLHGYDEAAPAPPDTALRRHGPLHPRNPPWIQTQFVVVAPQLPQAGDHWHHFGAEVLGLVDQVRGTEGFDPERMYLTGFSFGGNGVFDLAAAVHPWAALWAVDPTRVPGHAIDAPVWLSVGEAARTRKAHFVRALRLSPDPAGDRVYTDSGEDHVGSARQAYSSRSVYQWLLRQRRHAACPS